MNSQSLARGLAFFSVGLGLTQLLAPRPLARAIGIDESNETLLRLLGLRELSSGIGIMQGKPSTFLWARVGGDALHLALLSAALQKAPAAKRNRIIGALAAVAGVTVLDVIASLQHSRNPAEPEWRVPRLANAGLSSADPVESRRYTDEIMAAHQSGHLREQSSAGMLARETAATREFEPGD